MKVEEKKGTTTNKYSNSLPTVGVVGLGYVGLPVAIGFSEKYPVIGFDVDKSKIESLKKGIDVTGEAAAEQLKKSGINFTSQADSLKVCDFIIVAVPTPINKNMEPDLTYLLAASKTIGSHLKEGAVVIYESTVYPGATEEACIPVLQEYSGMKAGENFFVAYSPERINPGDKEHTFRTIEKVVSAQDEATLEKVFHLYQSVIQAPVFKAASIKVAETSKVLENTQRDINIALMNELSLICDKVGINTFDVLEAAKTKWNFLPFTPGLVGGHCIGVDPYYLIHKAKMMDYHPDFLASARRVNDSMAAIVTQYVLDIIIKNKLKTEDVQISVLGVTFKENVADIRNSKALEIVQQLAAYDLHLNVWDPTVNSEQFRIDNRVDLVDRKDLEKADIVLLLVPHQQFIDMSSDEIARLLKNEKSVIIDIKNIWAKQNLPENAKYITL
ncbi:nucleotide sugar dehydrogenase [Sediminibacillus albus]|uniref:UDP-N-acetyl-D-galactosamine dehydrogenase n=1 Tax=Sediminibacillus albus TaxID=407036 RepID=A0A1G9CCZ8_9BACI|nr:nucleotide sugar dehydrogenase [Sediminibacillus albus]SDK49552.1 UDP-N-acetyl-D-galactosamine dehydrogenase [Sediminibacillus albus]